MLKQLDGKFATSVFINPTDKGVYMNYNAFSPEIFKKSILKTLIFRAYKYSSTWLDFDTEINPLKQVFANNSYPQNVTELIINELLSKHHRDIIDTTRESIPHIDYYNKREDSERVNVVHQFTCSEGRYKAAYLGYTTNTLSTRCKQHRHCGSSI